MKKLEEGGAGMGRCEEDERRTGGGYNSVCVEPQSPGSVWTQRQQRQHLLWATGEVEEAKYNAEETKEHY